MNLLKEYSIKVSYNEPLSRHTTFRIGGICDMFCVPQDLDGLLHLLSFLEKEGKSSFLIGGGSNLLVSDSGFKGVVISLKGSSGFSKIEVKNDIIVCGAGANLQDVVRHCMVAGLGGLEFLAGIPGTVGGAIQMNAGEGIEGKDIGVFVCWIEGVDYSGIYKRFLSKQLRFSYRSSGLNNFIITKVAFRLNLVKDRKKSWLIYNQYLRRKHTTQELIRPSAGCIFRNPEIRDFSVQHKSIIDICGSKSLLSAGRLIEICGLKGARCGGAEVSRVHANFIINTGDATSTDVLSLISLIRKRIYSDFNIDLGLEIKLLGQMD